MQSTNHDSLPYPPCLSRCIIKKMTLTCTKVIDHPKNVQMTEYVCQCMLGLRSWTCVNVCGTIIIIIINAWILKEGGDKDFFCSMWCTIYANSETKWWWHAHCHGNMHELCFCVSESMAKKGNLYVSSEIRIDVWLSLNETSLTLGARCPCAPILSSCPPTCKLVTIRNKYLYSSTRFFIMCHTPGRIYLRR